MATWLKLPSGNWIDMAQVVAFIDHRNEFADPYFAATVILRHTSATIQSRADADAIRDWLEGVQK